MKAGTFKVLTVFALLALTQSAPAAAQSAAPSSFFGTAGRADEVSFSGLKSFEQYQASIVFIEPHYGRTASVATGVSDDGSVVVGYSLNAQGDPANGDASTQRAFRWTASTGTQDLGSLGLERTWANAVSGDGRVVVGGYYVGSYAWRPYRWVLGVGMQDLGTLGTDWSDAHDVSNDGSVVVGYSYGYCNLGYWGVFAWRWTQQTGLVCLGTLPGYRFTHGHGTSADGSVVVGETNRDWAPQWHESEAWRWTPESGMQGLGLLPPWGSSVAQDVSDNGAVVIGLLCNDHDYVDCWEYPYRSFWWRADVGMRDLGTLGGDQTSVWHAVTRDGGMVFGGSRTASGEWHAFRWTPERGMEDLNVLYASVIPSGWTLGAVWDSSPDGRYLVGWAKGPNGIIRAFLLSVESGPLPGIATLFPELSPFDPLHQVILRGQVDPQGGAVQVWFEWGTDPTLATYQITGTQTVFGDSTTVTATISIPLGVKHFYRIASTSGKGKIVDFTILLGKGNQDNPKWNDYDRLIEAYAARYRIPATVLKAVLLQESSLNKSAFRYEPIPEGKIRNKDKVDDYLLPDHPPRESEYPREYWRNQPWKDDTPMVRLPSDITMGRLWDEYSDRISMSKPKEGNRGKRAQWRVTSSYGLGQLVYIYQGDKIGWDRPEAFYDPYTNIEATARNLAKPDCLGDFTDFPLGGISRSVLHHNWGPTPCWYQSVAALREDCRQQELWCADPKWWKGDWPAYLVNVANKISLVQPTLVRGADTRTILPPPAAGGQVALSPPARQAMGEVELDRLIADFKGTGQPQLAVLYGRDDGAGMQGVLRIFADTAGDVLEWESPPMPGITTLGTIYTQTLGTGGAPLIIASWGVGAHSELAYFFRWQGGQFRAIGVVEGGEAYFGVLADASISIDEHGLAVAQRDLEEPLAGTILSTYAWQEEQGFFAFEKREILRPIPFRLYLPLVIRSGR